MIHFINKILSVSNSRVLLISAAIGAGYYFFVFDDGAKLKNNQKTLEVKLRKTKRELEKFKQILSSKAKYGDMLPQILKSIEHVIQYLPEHFTINNLIDTLTSELRASGADVVSIQNGRKAIYPKNPNIEEISIDVVLKGNYSQILTFLSLLTKLKLIVRFKNMNLSFDRQLEEQRFPVLKMTGVIIAYRYLEEKDEGKEQKQST